MCVIAAKPANIIIPEDTLKRCFEGNSDGAGFVIAKNNRLVSQKGFFKFEDFYEAFRPYENDTAVIHFRIKTHGKRDAEMCHPFQVLENKLFVAHNGIIDIETSSDSTKSDTWHFVDKVLQPELTRDPASLSRGSFQYLLGCTIGGSKLAFLNNRGVITIINKAKGEMDGEVWYSNGSYRTPRVSVSSGYTGGSTNYYTGGTTSKKSSSGSADENVVGSSCSNGVKKGSVVHSDFTKIPMSDMWIIEELRAFGFSDEEILDEVNGDTAQDVALDLLVHETRMKDVEGVEPMTREEIALDLLQKTELSEELSEALEEGVGSIASNMMV